MSTNKVEKRDIELCDVLYFTENKIAFNFKGYGIICDNNLNINSKKVKVSYTKDIGAAEFEFKIIR